MMMGVMYTMCYVPYSTAGFSIYHRGLFISLVFCRWFLEVQNIYYNGNKRKLLPKSNQPQLLESYFNCAATLMTSQLQTLALKVKILSFRIN